eukprot:gene15977-biopygen12704
MIDHAGLGWAGLGWAGLGWAGLGWAGLRCILFTACPSTTQPFRRPSRPHSVTRSVPGQSAAAGARRRKQTRGGDGIGAKGTCFGCVCPRRGLPFSPWRTLLRGRVPKAQRVAALRRGALEPPHCTTASARARIASESNHRDAPVSWVHLP